jgi:hypothetical protein
MTIEKVFSIEGSPERIWEALWSDLASGSEGSYAVESSHWPTSLTLEVHLAALPCLLSYRIERRDDGHCEVAATIEPRSVRYGLYQVLTFGHLRRNFEMMLVIGLSNLKAAVEGGEEQIPPDV